MDSNKIYEAAKSSLSENLTRSTPADALLINEAIAKAIVAAFEEYEKSKMEHD